MIHTFKCALATALLPLALHAQPVLEQQHMNWGNPLNQAEFEAQRPGTSIQRAMFTALYDDEDAEGWAYDTATQLGAPGSKLIHGMIWGLADIDFTTAHTMQIFVFQEDAAAPGTPDLVTPVAGFAFNLAGGNYIFTFPTPVVVPAGEVWLGIELGVPTIAPGVVESGTDALGILILPTSAAASAAGINDVGAVRARGIGHNLSINGGYGLLFETTPPAAFFLEGQIVATPLAPQPSFSLASTTNLTTMPNSNPGGTPGYTTSFASAHTQPWTTDVAGNARMDDTVFVLRDQNPLWQLPPGTNPGEANYAIVLFLDVVGVGGAPFLPLDLILAGNIGSYCLSGVPGAAIDFGIAVHPAAFDVDGYYTFTIPNMAAMGAEGAIPVLGVQALIVDFNAPNLTVHGSGCVKIHST